MVDNEIREVAERIVNKLFEDVVEVVRCKDCKYSKPSVISDRWVCTTYSLPGDLKADDFCSRGERKDEKD